MTCCRTAERKKLQDQNHRWSTELYLATHVSVRLLPFRSLVLNIYTLTMFSFEIINADSVIFFKIKVKWSLSVAPEDLNQDLQFLFILNASKAKHAWCDEDELHHTMHVCPCVCAPSGNFV